MIMVYEGIRGAQGTCQGYTSDFILFHMQNPVDCSQLQVDCLCNIHPLGFSSDSRMSSSKAKASGVSATSFFDLKSELSKKEAELTKAKAEGRHLSVVGGLKRPDKVCHLKFLLHSLY